MQLVAYGAQDVYLTGNPEITFFKIVYKKHTSFAIEAIEQTFSGEVGFNRKSSVSLIRNGDLVTKMYLKTKLQSSFNDQIVTNSNGNNVVMAINPVASLVGTESPTNGIDFNIVDNILVITDSDAKGEWDEDNFSEGKIIEIQGTANNHDGFYEVKERIDSDTLKVMPKESATGDENNQTATVSSFSYVEWVDKLGYALINSVELQIGGTKIDKHYGEWMHIWQQLSRSCCHGSAEAELIGGGNRLKNQELFVPLDFFCCNNDGLAIPLIALQYHDVRLVFDFSSAESCCSAGSSSVSVLNGTLLVDYIYLDSEERKRFAQASHEYLIEQLQFTGVEPAIGGKTNKYELNFNHPCKELIWIVKNSGDSSKYKFINFTNNTDIEQGKNTIDSAILQLNGHDRFSPQPGKYFQNLQVLEHHSHTPDWPGVNVYSFALNPEDQQPSGTCNFSRIDNAVLSLDINTPGEVHIFATSYNVLRIMSGMGGLAYSN